MKLEKLIQQARACIQRGTGYLSHGNDGTIYAVNEKVILKLHNGGYHGCPQKSAEHEYALGTELYQQRVQVPEYIGLFSAPLRKQECWGVFMERIHGVEPSGLPSTLQLEAQRQYQEQKKQVDRLGYLISKDSKKINSNTLFDQRRRKLFLFDLVQWKRK